VSQPPAYNQTFNVGADIPYSVNYLAEQVQLALGKHTEVVHFPGREEVLHAFSDHSKSREVFGLAAPITLEEGLQRMAAWVKQVGAREGKPFDNIEVEREMPPSWRKLCTTAKLSV
jgi:UDP-glucose 4-epimerase